tara:strand:- start:3129 stop:3806 length:678 start_codon:yes stop_codon:yes gene_type:complete
MKVNFVYNLDALDFIGELRCRSIDLIILDPSYDQWDYFISKGLIAECERVLKNTGNILCFTKQPFDFNLRKSVAHIFRRELVWTFTNGGAWVSKKLPLVSFQKIFHCVLDKTDAFFEPRSGVPYSSKTKDFKRSSKVFEGYNQEGRNFCKDDRGTWIRDHYHFNKPHTGSLPSKPEELSNILLQCYCPPQGLFLDPFCGSGVFLKSCTNQGKTFFASDLQPKVLE